MDAAAYGAGRVGPLTGVRVLDLSRVLAGPWCTQCLADLGADVLKIEQPGTGDETRGWGPPEMGGMAAYYVCANRSKLSLALDFTKEEDLRTLVQLASVADVIVENFKLGTFERYGLDYPAVSRSNPGVVYCSISGYGRTGSEAARPGYDFVIQGESGLMSITGEPDGTPMKVGVAVSDLFAGLYASQAILAALIGREATGKGTHVDVSLFDCQLAALANVASNALATERVPARFGNTHPNVVPYEVYDASDGPMVLAVGNDRQFEKLCDKVLDVPQLARDAKFSTNRMRSANRQELRTFLQQAIALRTRAEWIEELTAQSIPAGIIRTVKEALDSRQASERGLIGEKGEGDSKVRFVRYPVKLSTPLPAGWAPPRLGQGGEETMTRWLSGNETPKPVTPSPAARHHEP